MHHFARFGVSLAIVAMVSSTACASSYRGAPVTGRVIDATTKEPLENVVVVSEWLLEGGLHTDTIGRLQLQETVTDAQGAYRLAGWGPLRAEKGELNLSSPILHFYKRGHRFKSLRNDLFDGRKRFVTDPLLSDWTGKTVELEAHTDTTSETRLKELLGASYLYSVDDMKCAWQQMPRMTAELMARKREYSAKGIYSGLPGVQELHRNGRCADPNEILREFLW